MMVLLWTKIKLALQTHQRFWKKWLKWLFIWFSFYSKGLSDRKNWEETPSYIWIHRHGRVLQPAYDIPQFPGKTFSIRFTEHMLVIVTGNIAVLLAGSLHSANSIQYITYENI